MSSTLQWHTIWTNIAHLQFFNNLNLFKVTVTQNIFSLWMVPMVAYISEITIIYTQKKQERKKKKI